jgi:hypothetical protein
VQIQANKAEIPIAVSKGQDESSIKAYAASKCEAMLSEITHGLRAEPAVLRFSRS